jgi:hypothetical protein
VVPPNEANNSGELVFVTHKAREIAKEDPSNTQSKRSKRVFIASS